MVAVLIKRAYLSFCLGCSKAVNLRKGDKMKLRTVIAILSGLGLTGAVLATSCTMMVNGDLTGDICAENPDGEITGCITLRKDSGSEVDAEETHADASEVLADSSLPDGTALSDTGFPDGAADALGDTLLDGGLDSGVPLTDSGLDSTVDAADTGQDAEETLPDSYLIDSSLMDSAYPG